MKNIVDNKVTIPILGSMAVEIIIMYFMSTEAKFAYHHILLAIMIVFVIVQSFLYGIVCGVVSPLLAIVITGVLLEFHFDMTRMFIFVIYGFSLGYFSKRIKAFRSRLTSKNIFGMNIIVFSLSALIFIFSMPLQRFLFEKQDLYDNIILGAKEAGIVCLLSLFVATPIIVIVNRIVIKKK